MNPKRHGGPGGRHLPPTEAEAAEVEALLRAAQERLGNPYTGRPATLKEVVEKAGIKRGIGDRRKRQIPKADLEKLRALLEEK